MRLPQTDPNDSGSIDIEQLKKMVDLFIERGFTYFDTAWMYNAFKSENAVREVLTSRHPRETLRWRPNSMRVSLRRWKTETGSSTPSWRRPAPLILIII